MLVLWSGIMGWVDASQAAEYIEENWYIISVEELMIPFTTQLDAKNSAVTNAYTLLWLAVLCFALMLQPLSEAWRGLGGTLRLIQLKFAVLLPEFVPLFLLGAASASFSTYAATISAFATANTVPDLLWQAAMSVLAMLAILGAVWANVQWGITFVTHATTALTLLPPAVIMLGTSLATLTRADDVEGFVRNNWEEIQQFVPPRYALVSWEKYALAAYTPMMQSAATGLMLACFLFGSVYYHLRCAAVLLAVGSELYVAKTKLSEKQDAVRRSASMAVGLRLQPEDAALPGTAASAAIAASLTVPSPNPRMGGTAGTVSNESYETLESGEDRDGSAHEPFLTIADSSSMSAGGGAAHEPLQRAKSMLAMIRGANGSGSGSGKADGTLMGSPRHGGYGATSPVQDWKGTAPGGGATRRTTFADIEGEQHRSGAALARLAEPVRAPAVSQLDATGVRDVYSSDTSTQDMISMLQKAYSTTATHHEELYAQYQQTALVARQFQYWAQMYDQSLNDLNQRVQWPSVTNFVRNLALDFRHMYHVHRMCFWSLAVLLIVAVGAIAGGLANISVASQCGVLAREPAKRDYATWLQIEVAQKITIRNFYPYGSIEIIDTHAEVFPDPITHNVSIELTAYAADPADLPSQAELARFINATSYIPASDSDDDPGGYLSIVLDMLPPADADKKCLGLRLRLRSPANLIQYTVESKRAMVNITGNFDDLTASVSAPPTMQTLAVTTEDAPVVLRKAFVERLGLTPPNFAPSLTVTSKTGDVLLDTVNGAGLLVDTGGNIRTTTFGSASVLQCMGVCGDVTLRARGSGRIVISQAVLAYNAYWTTDHGDIVVSNSGMLIGKDIVMKSIDGDIVMSNFLQANGNETFAMTSGKVTLSIATVNRLYIMVGGTGTVSILEALLGCASGGNAYNPPILTNYSAPLVYVSTEYGDISVLGTGGLNGENSNAASMELISARGNIKAEVNGGGINANYTVGSKYGDVHVELNGVAAGPSGELGQGIGTNYVRVYSDAGNAQLALLPTPY